MDLLFIRICGTIRHEYLLKITLSTVLYGLMYRPKAEAVTLVDNPVTHLLISEADL